MASKNTPAPAPNQTRRAAAQAQKAQAKAQEKAEKKQIRHDKIKAKSRAVASRNSHQVRPLAINVSALATGIMLHDVSPTIGASVGLAAAAATAVNTWLGRNMSDAERKHTVVHGLGAAGWAALAGLAGPFTPALGVAGGIGAIVAHATWAERRSIRKPTTAERATSSEWNAVADTNHANTKDGILSRAGFPGAVMFHRDPIRDANGTQIGFRYHVDISDADCTADWFVSQAPAKIAKELPGRTRKGAVTVYENDEDVNHVILEVIWQKQWSMDVDLLHPIVQYLPELTNLVHTAIENHQAGGVDANGDPIKPVAIPRHLRRFMPNMATIRDPLIKGLKEDQSYATEQVFRKGYGTLHKFGVGWTGSGKTSDINSEIASMLPCRDVVIWAIDVSAKRGKHFAPWGSCIDWLAVEIPDANAMLKAVVNIANARGRHYRNGAVVSPKTAPVLVLIIDELPALWEELGSEKMNEFLSSLARQARAQGIRLEAWGQRGVQTDYGFGFKSFVSQCGSRTLLKVTEEHEAGFVVKHPELIQTDVTKMLAGEGIDQDAMTGEMTHRRGWLVREADDEADEDTFEAIGDIPGVAALYAPFRPKLDAVSAQAAGEAYANRTAVIPNNPLLTPQEVTRPRVVVEPPVSEDDQDAVISQVRTNISWLDAILDGRLTVSGIHAFTEDGEPVSDNEESQMNVTELDASAALLEMGVPTGESHAAREKRGQMMREIVDNQLAEAVSEVEAIAKGVATIPTGTSLTEAVGRTETPQRYADDDPIVKAALALMGKHGSKGAPVGAIVDELAKTGKKKSRETVLSRLRDLANRKQAVMAGTGRGARWYLPHHAPTSEGGDQPR